MEFKSLKFDAAQIDPDARTFEGYAAAYGNTDSDNDVIEQGAFAKSIKEAFPAGSIKVLWQHDARQPIGLPVEMREDSRGLWVKSRISRTAKGDEALELMRDGVINRLSVGFSIPGGKSQIDEKGIRRITEGKLFEYSLVTWPANDQAVITGVKTLKEMRELAENEHLSTKARNELLAELASITALLKGEPLQGTRTGQQPPLSNDQLKSLINSTLGELALSI
jgi:HK97 family phage prohead protease